MKCCADPLSAVHFSMFRKRGSHCSANSVRVSLPHKRRAVLAPYQHLPRLSSPFSYRSFRVFLPCATMSTDWDSKLVIGHKARVAKVTKKDSDLNGT